MLPFHIYHIRSKYLIGTSEFMHIVQILMQFFMLNLNTLSDLEFKQILRCYWFHFCEKNAFFMQNNHKGKIYTSIISLICS